MELAAVDEETATRLAAEFPGAAPVAVAGRRGRSPSTPPRRPPAWAQRERDAGRVEEFSVTPMDLEDVYIRLVGPDRGAGATREEGHAPLPA